MKTFIKSSFISLKQFNWRLWLVLAVTLFIPALYITLRIYFLGNISSDWGVNIASQLSWVNLIYEIIQEAVILPLFFLLGKSIISKEELENKTKTGLLISGGTYLFLSILIIALARPLCKFMASDKTTIEQTITYIRLETIATTVGILTKFITVLFVTINKDKYMYIILIIQTILTIILDIFLVSNLKISLQMGVNGIAISNIIVSLLLLIISFILLKKENINVFSKQKLNFSWLKEYGKIGLYSGLESLVRNVAFMLMVSRLINVIAEQGTFWVSNNFIWTWLLLPATALYDVIKKETAENIKNIENKTLGYILISIIFSLLILLSIPIWKPFIKYVMNSPEYNSIFYIVLIQVGFYILYIINCIFDGTIYGRGKTKYMLIQSLFTNGIYYVTMFILWKTNVFIPTLTSISLMFGIGIAIDLLPTIGCYIFLLKKNNLKIKWNLLNEKEEMNETLA